jgi:hypothetical protein
MVSEAHAPSRRGYPYAVTRDGLTYVFDTEEEQSRFVEAVELSREERMDKALRMLDELDHQILERTAGRGIEPGAIDDALSAMRDH